MKNTARWGFWIVTAAALLAPLASCARGGSDRMAMDSGVTLPGLDGGARDTGTPPTDTGVDPRDTGVVTDTGVGGGCSETPCRLLPPQCGCPAGQGCYLTGGTERTCATQGPEREGQACSGVTACQAGLLCAGSAGAAFCSRFCNGDADCTAGPGSICIIELSDGAGGSIPGVRLCSAQCVPPTANGCPTGMACSIFGETDGAMRTFTGCTPAGTAPTGASCVDSEDCSPGHFCGDPGTGNECIRLCTVSTGGPECGAFETCNSFSDPAIVGGTEYGFCF